MSTNPAQGADSREERQLEAPHGAPPRLPRTFSGTAYRSPHSSGLDVYEAPMRVNTLQHESVGIGANDSSSWLGRAYSLSFLWRHLCCGLRENDDAESAPCDAAVAIDEEDEVTTSWWAAVVSTSRQSFQSKLILFLRPLMLQLASVVGSGLVAVVLVPSVYLLVGNVWAACGLIVAFFALLCFTMTTLTRLAFRKDSSRRDMLIVQSFLDLAEAAGSRRLRWACKCLALTCQGGMAFAAYTLCVTLAFDSVNQLCLIFRKAPTADSLFHNITVFHVGAAVLIAILSCRREGLIRRFWATNAFTLVCAAVGCGVLATTVVALFMGQPEGEHDAERSEPLPFENSLLQHLSRHCIGGGLLRWYFGSATPRRIPCFLSFHVQSVVFFAVPLDRCHCPLRLRVGMRSRNVRDFHCGG